MEGDVILLYKYRDYLFQIYHFYQNVELLSFHCYSLRNKSVHYCPHVVELKPLNSVLPALLSLNTSKRMNNKCINTKILGVDQMC